MTMLYDSIGKTYAEYRRPDPRIFASIITALCNARSVVNIGAGAGSYEPADREVIAVEPSTTMIGQRPAGAAAAVRASAMNLPFRDDQFDAALAIFTVHHWPDQKRGLTEMRRVARRAVILTWEPLASPSWLTRDYFPEILSRDRGLFPPALSYYRAVFDEVEIMSVPIPHDCTDGFLEAYWRRPEAYLDAGARAAISPFATMRDLDSGLARLRRDLDDGTWLSRNGHLLALAERDLGYRLVVGTRAS
jgi:SAM-dependent methyltransferase